MWKKSYKSSHCPLTAHRYQGITLSAINHSLATEQSIKQANIKHVQLCLLDQSILKANNVYAKKFSPFQVSNLQFKPNQLLDISDTVL